MTLRDLLFEGEQVANANPANVAKDRRADNDTLAGLALAKERGLKKARRFPSLKPLPIPPGHVRG